MGIVLQVILIAFCLFLFGIIIQQITSSRVIFSDFNYWIVFTVVLTIMAIFPSSVVMIARLIQIETPVVAVFLIVIFLLILLVLSASFRISVLNRRFIQLSQKIALLEHDMQHEIEETTHKKIDKKPKNKK